MRGRTHDADVLVVGAGPAGAAAACFLADAGHRVVLLDRRRFPREKPCGEGILPAGVDVLREIGIAGAIAADGGQAFGGIRYHAPDGRTAVGAFPAGASGLGVRRAVLDRALLEAARSRKGVTVVERFAVRALLQDERGAVTGVTDGERAFRAPLTIGADGTHSIVRTCAGLDGPPTARRAVRMHFRVPDGIVEPLVDVYVGHGGEVYVTPVGPDEIGVALLVEGGFPKAATGADATRVARSGERRIREALAARGGIARRLAAAPAASTPMAAVGTGTTARRSLADGLLLLGDAAGAPDPITGMGISFALRCARGLPDALAPAFRTGDFSAARMGAYVALRRREVASGYAVTRAVRWLAASDLRAGLAVRAVALAPRLFTAAFTLAQGRP